ncbi:TOBE domain-containing protein [Litorihabitans aurantiacus]|uniref:MerR family transcriptional regulator n=1 Tax=Litorihabitans aurantiacus TaxID=1930061 RepID=A0AA37XGL5_9MICO|nr:TOBE domain-containing protein [Litorihabitans aurantiacus]GMA33328.1 MerR family transcriptional regulator [Litorihabitans aurantiacus]
MSARDIRVAEAAALLGVSTDTVRRRAQAAGIEPSTTAGVTSYPAAAVARLATEQAAAAAAGHDQLGDLGPASARNRLRGIVTRVVRDGVMAQVEVQAGAFRVVSLISREAADELGLEEGSLVAATVKATNVGIEGITR